MYSADADALLCDMAEIYGIFDLQALPCRTVATLASGLPDDCRIRRSMSGTRVSFRDLMLAAAVDRLALLVWMQTKDAQKGRNRPDSIVAKLTADPSEEVVGFATADSFEAARARILRGGADVD